MKLFYSLFVLSIFHLVVSVSAQSILPIPSLYQQGESRFFLDDIIEFSCPDEKLAAVLKHDFNDFKTSMNAFYGVNVSLKSGDTTRVILRLLSDSIPVFMYRISVADSVFIEASSPEGFSYAFTTLLQSVSKENNKHYWPAMTLADKPFVKQRVLKIDLTNGTPDLSIVKRQVLLMKHLKLNVLVLVLSNRDVSLFPFKGVSSLGFTYSRTEIKELVKFANNHNIRVVPQVSLPIAGWITDIDPTTVVSEAADSLKLPDIVKEQTWITVEKLLTDLKSTFPDSMVILSLGEKRLSRFYQDAMAALVPNSDWQTLVSTKLSAIAKKKGNIYVLDELYFRPVDKKNLAVRVTSVDLLATALQYGLRAYAANEFVIDEDWKSSTVFSSGDKLIDNLRNADGVEITMSESWYKSVTLEARLWPSAIDGAQLLWSKTPSLSRDLYSELLGRRSVDLEMFGATHLTTPSIILRRQTGMEGNFALSVLLNTLEPVGGVSNTLSFSDAVVKTSYDVRSFSNAIREFLIVGKSEANFLLIRDMFQLWINNDMLLESTFAEHPEWGDLKKLSASLASIARIGDEALFNSVKAKEPKPAWIVESKRKLKNLGEPVAGMQFGIVEAIIGLIQFSEAHDEIVF